MSALPTDSDTRVHWIVTVALAGAATSNDRLATTQRDAYREYRGYLVDLLLQTDTDWTRDGSDAITTAGVEAERLIALVDGIALQALFDPQRWSVQRQRVALGAGIELGAWSATVTLGPARCNSWGRS
jgi:hypothetical protein